MNLTCKNQVFHYDTRRRIKSWNSGSVPIVVIPILENPVNSYDSNGVIAIPISILGDEKRNLLYFQGGHNTIGIMRNSSELMEKFQKSVLQITALGGDEVWTPN